MKPSELKNVVINKIDDIQEDLWDISSFLYENPETAFNEHEASKKLVETLVLSGFDVETGIADLDTAFKAKKIGGSIRPNVALLAEYDALPELGHACGHNLIAAASLGAAIGLLDVINQLQGTISVIGTPAEEGGGGKKIIAKAGYFNDIDAAMMFHPANKNIVTRGSLASTRLRLEFFGKASHAAAAPEDGINALDACLLTFNNIHALRQHLKPKDRIAGIITHGGDAANIIPAYTSAEFSVRGVTTLRRNLVLEKVIKCAQAGAQATGSTLKYYVNEGYAEIIPNKVLAGLFTQNLESLGRSVVEPDPLERMGSTDMGDISYLVPSIHPYLATVPEGIPGHTEEFRNICHTPAGKSAMLDAAKSLAMTSIDLLIHEEMIELARNELDSYLENHKNVNKKENN